MSTLSKLWGWRSFAVKTAGIAAALAVGASTLVAAPAQAAAPGDDFAVWQHPIDYNSFMVCVDPSSGVSESFNGTTTVGLDAWHSSDWYDDADNWDQVDITSVTNTNCGAGNLQWTVDGFEPEEDLYIKVSNSLLIISEGDAIDRAGEGSSYYNEDDDYWYYDNVRIDASLAYGADEVSNERETAVLCVEPYNYNFENGWPYWSSMDYIHSWTIRSYNVTDQEYEDLDWSYDEPWDMDEEGIDYLCNYYDDLEIYVHDLELGDTYEFNFVSLLDTNYLDDCGFSMCEGDYNEYYDSSWSNWFTPLDVHSEQWSLFSDNNDGCDGDCEAEDDTVWDWTAWGNGNEANQDNYARLWVDAPHNFYSYNFWNSEADWDIYDRYGDEWNDNDFYPSQVGYDGYSHYEYTTSDTHYMGNNDFDGQGFVQAYFNFCGECDWVWEGLSDTYIDNMDLQWNSDWVRAIASDTVGKAAVEMVIETGLTDNWWQSYYSEWDTNTNSYLDPSEGTYYIKATPNDGARDDEDEFDYNGNEMPTNPTRYETLEWTFSPADDNSDTLNFDTLGTVHGQSCGYGCGYDMEQGAIKVVLDGLQPGTTYDIEYRAVLPYNGDASYWDRDNGDGGYEYVQFRDSVAWFATTYLSSHVDQVTADSARFLVDVTDSHMNYANLQKNADNGFYWALNECTDYQIEEDSWTDCNELGDSDNETRFDANHITVSKVSTDTQDLIHKRVPTAEWGFLYYDDDLEEDVYGWKTVYAVHDFVAINVEGLKPDTKYEVVAGFDYWYLDQDPEQFYWFDNSDYSYEFAETLNGDRCESNVFDVEDDADFGTDCYNSTSANEIFRTDVTKFRTLDTVAPVLVESSVDTNDDDKVLVDSDITFWFSEDIQLGTGAIKLFKYDGTLVRSFDPEKSPYLEVVEGNGLHLHNAGFLDYSTTYYVEFSEGSIVDLVGNALETAYTSLMTTEDTDTDGPVVESVVTVDGEGDGVDTNTTFTLTFDENVTAGNGVIEIRKTSNDAVVRTLVANASKQVMVSGNTVVISGGSLLSYGTGYYLLIKEGAFKDAHGNANLDDSSFVFTTESMPAHTGDARISASYSGGWRDITLLFGDEMAGQVVDVYWVSRHTDQKRIVRSIQLDEHGDAVISAKIVRFERLDGIQVMLGRHSIAWETAKLA